MGRMKEIRRVLCSNADRARGGGAVVGITASGSLVRMEWSRARHIVGMVRGICMRCLEALSGNLLPVAFQVRGF